MQFYSGSTTSNSQQEKRSSFNYQQNFNLMVQQHQVLMQLFNQYSNLDLNTPSLQTPFFYNQRITNSYVIVGKEEAKNQGFSTTTPPSSDCSDAPLFSEKKNATQYNQQSSAPTKSSKLKIKPQSYKKRKNFQSEDDYSPEEEQPYDFSEPKISESKNIPKIFGKGILNFISKQKEFTDRVLAHFGVEPIDFETSLEHFKKHISSIADLRSLWVDEDNKFSKVYRVLSKEYIRKHSLSYIFNSRVTSVNKHIKYRHKIQQGIQAPESFTNMKEY